MVIPYLNQYVRLQSCKELLSTAKAPPFIGTTPPGRKLERPQSECLKAAFICPYCGECTMEQFFSEEGCPSHAQVPAKKEVLFPYLDISGLDENDRIDLEYQLIAETREIKVHFAKFLSNVITSLEQICIQLEKFKIFVLSLEAFTDDIGVKVLDKEDAQKIETASTISEVFMTLRKYISFFNYHILEYIIDQHGAETDRAQLQEYLKKFHIFCQRSIFKVPQYMFAFKFRQAARVFAFKCTEGVNTTMEDVKTLTGDIAKVFGLRSSALQLYTLKKGCVELHYLISAAVVERIFPVSPTQSTTLKEIGVRILSCEELDQTNKDEIR